MTITETGSVPSYQVSLMLRKALFLPLMAAAIGGPLFFFSDDEKSTSTDGGGEDLSAAMSLTRLDSSQNPIYPSDQNLDEIMDFRLTPQAIESRWKNVTKSALKDRQIYRTSILSGLGPADPMGALTYQFDFNGKLRSIRFSGYVEDPNRFIGFLSSKFGFASTGGQSNEYRPTAFSGYNGSLQLSKSPAQQKQLQVELWIDK